MPIVTAKHPRLKICAPVLLFGGLLFAGFASQPWDRPSNTWTPDDVNRILASSPWTLQVSAAMADPLDIREPQPTNTPPLNPAQNGPGGTPNPATPPWDGGPGHNRMGRLATVPVTVRWDSAAPVREALAKAGTASKPVAEPATAYVITLQGLIPSGKYRSAGHTESTSQSDSSTDARNPEEVLEAFMSYSKLMPRGGSAIHPENVRLDADTGAIHIFFPRDHPLESGFKEVDFTTHFGGLNVRAKFRLPGMKYQGKLAL
jgi:hypothetical protein